MKKAALIVIPIFLLLSIALTVYLVVTQRIELRKKAAPTPYPVNYCAKTYQDRCPGGPYIEIEQLGPPTYEGGLQKFKLRAKRVGVRTDVTQPPTVTPHEVQCTSRTDCEPKAPVCQQASACSQQQCVFVNRPNGFTCTGGKCSDGACVPNPTATTRPAATNTSAPQPSNTNIPQPSNTTAPQPSNTPASGQALGASINSTIDVLLVGYTCSAATIGQCSNCGPDDPVYKRQEQWLKIPAGSNTSGEYELAIQRYGDGATCGCVQMDLYIVSVKVGGVDMGCPARGNTTSGYLCAAGNGGNCAGVSTNTPGPSRPPVSRTPTPRVSRTPTPRVSRTPTPRVSRTPTPTITPGGPTLTPTPTTTTTTNQNPICVGLSASPTSGTAPLTVHFIGTGEDSDGPVKKFEFDWGDGKTQTIEKDVGSRGTVEIDHTYTLSGTFISTLRIQDNNGAWSSPSDDCSASIEPSGGPTVSPRPTSTPTLLAKGGTGPTPTVTKIPTVKASPQPTAVEPDVPVSGGIMPTMLVGFTGLLIIGLGLLFAL